MGEIILIFLAILVIVFVVNGVKMIRQAEVQVIERLGRYNKTLSSGLNIIIPIVDKPRYVIWRYQQAGPDGENIYYKNSHSL